MRCSGLSYGPGRLTVLREFSQAQSLLGLCMVMTCCDAVAPVCDHILTFGNALWVKGVYLPLTLEESKKCVCIYMSFHMDRKKNSRKKQF